MTYAILSPHLDDAVINCWQAITAPNSRVITVFAGLPPKGTTTIWDRLCGNANSREMIAQRRQENNKALATITAQVINLDFLDSQYRRSAISPESLALALHKYLPRGTTLLAPLACSRWRRHPDHVLLREAARLLAQDGYKVNFYADAPYVLLPKRLTRSASNKLLKQAEKYCHMDLRPQAVLLSTQDVTAKQAALATYASQYAMTNIISFGRLGRSAKRDYELVFTVES